ncbi:MAG TPA: cell division ATP-binding protein FtsE [Candidatus Marinimicrobia bacterium]|nr:cell division ATP-binding protein FtsE [Candidatus Neomarinimicrobiota bacterium]HRS52336.1 cell division ATP-binding protein FtsE [Candidatus Neomarinimicrobiota bacterium]HRU92074.1 cell division ATP-binding protein FtsE [Candidatus Neomarinimicrobiota bacterium]
MITFFNVSCTFGKDAGIKNVNLTINEGEFVFLTGSSGAGKSTLLRLIYMDLFPEKGKVVIRNFDSSKVRPNEIPFLRRKVGMIFQDFRLLEDRNVYENVALSLYVSHYKTREIKNRVYNVLNQVGLGHRVYYNPKELSGGEQQRVAIARALVKEPVVLLADEPTGNLDPRVASDLMSLLIKINQNGTAVIVATHNYSLIPRVANARIIQVNEGEIINPV